MSSTPEKKEKEAAARFKEHMGSFFHDMMRAAGMTMVQASATERIRSTGERMASAIETAATRKAISVIRLLQTAVTEAFIAMEKALKEVKKVGVVHNTLIQNLLEDSLTSVEEIEKLKARITQLEAHAVDNIGQKIGQK